MPIRIYISIIAIAYLVSRLKTDSKISFRELEIGKGIKNNTVKGRLNRLLTTQIATAIKSRVSTLYKNGLALPNA